MYDHKAEAPDELSFDVGEVLTILGPGEDEGWLMARNAKNQQGLVPSNYLHDPRLPLPTQVPPTQVPPTQVPPGWERVVDEKGTVTYVNHSTKQFSRDLSSVHALYQQTPSTVGPASANSPSTYLGPTDTAAAPESRSTGTGGRNAAGANAESVGPRSNQRASADDPVPMSFVQDKDAWKRCHDKLRARQYSEARAIFGTVWRPCPQDPSGGGVGISFGAPSPTLPYVITSVDPRGAAARAGIKVGAQLTAVDTVPCLGRSVEELQGMLMGPVGTMVTLVTQDARGIHHLDTLMRAFPDTTYDLVSAAVAHTDQVLEELERAAAEREQMLRQLDAQQRELSAAHKEALALRSELKYRVDPKLLEEQQRELSAAQQEASTLRGELKYRVDPNASIQIPKPWQQMETRPAAYVAPPSTARQAGVGLQLAMTPSGEVEVTDIVAGVSVCRLHNALCHCLVHSMHVL